ncbi:LTA synthase family protein [Sulfitobacter sp. KE34]|uniref:LTA synthase family protein n=1 Tax=unclassified Sulfitobacter TaxID=196795 RepID=UPI0023E232F1|nr:MULTISPECIES: LTA synthase family protein [unclassified Sulfitobacter]MDF3352137.1 LTA synthase family protein [Sulfitobacter sp. KE12]MDF3355793.1 LTA synthase family protein [Sulfitobacter sp. KE27]MDF3359243.1 LTA synthase family protein [Sulfitobacter sp. KE33]MDF3366693.1 LTA synthase family protein [Sulfitobacter sp. Ks34]MDF3370475.1 LTA synthase family protein [Sulfitobacter sp. Ks43]
MSLSPLQEATMPSQNSGAHNYLRLLVALTVLTLLHRFLALNLDATYNFGATYYRVYSKFTLYQEWWAQYQVAILRGLRSDVFFILAASCVAFALKPRRMILPLFTLSLFYAANIEHLRYNFSHIRLGTLHMALNPTFIAGSGLTPEFLFNLFALTAISVITYRTTRAVRTLHVGGVMAAVMVGAAITLPQSFSPLEPGWMQTHPLSLSPRSTGAIAGPEDFPSDALSKPNLEPVLRVNPSHNVLLVYLEGVSQYSLSSGNMPFLESLAQRNLSFSRYFGNQLQTNNGLYTSLTGHYPNFVGSTSPWDTLTAETAAALSSLPNVLARHGYSTAFLQSADLSFMHKASHLAQLGFQEVKGRESWSNFHSENGWGIDDLGLFEASLEHIDTLPKNTPWLVSLLTSGTHAPYNVPARFLPEAPDRLRALKYADQAAETLMKNLRERGLLENTVVIFTADESREPGGLSNLENEILLNWLPLIVVHPTGQSGEIDWPVGATAFRELALLFAGDWSPSDLNVLNRPNTPLIFGNHYKHRVFWFDRQQKNLYACYTQNFLCARFTNVTDLTKLAGMEPTIISHETKMQAVFQSHEIHP